MPKITRVVDQRTLISIIIEMKNGCQEGSRFFCTYGHILQNAAAEKPAECKIQKSEEYVTKSISQSGIFVSGPARVLDKRRLGWLKRDEVGLMLGGDQRRLGLRLREGLGVFSKRKRRGSSFLCLGPGACCNEKDLPDL